MPEIRGEALSRHLADAGAHHLHRGHQRPRKQRGPQQLGSQLRAGNGIRGNARRVVVSSPGNDPGPERLQQRSNPARWGSGRQRKVSYLSFFGGRGKTPPSLFTALTTRRSQS